MPFTFRCPGCGHALRVGASAAGRACRCPYCREQIVVPGGRPSRRSGKKPSLWVAAVVLGLLLLGGSGVVAWFMLGADRSVEALDFMPDKCRFVVAVDVPRALKSPALKEMFVAAKPNEWVGIETSNIARITVGSAGADDMTSETIVVIETKKPPTIPEIKSKLAQRGPTFAKKQAGDRIYYQFDVKDATYTLGTDVFEKKTVLTPVALSLVGERMVVYGHPKTLERVLRRTRAPELDKKMKDALAGNDPAKAINVAMIFGPSKKPAGGQILRMFGVDAEDMESLTVAIQSAADLGFTAVMTMANRAATEKAARQLDQAARKDVRMKSMLKELKTKRHKQAITVTGRLDLEPLLKWQRLLSKMPAKEPGSEQGEALFPPPGTVPAAIPGDAQADIRQRILNRFQIKVMPIQSAAIQKVYSGQFYDVAIGRDVPGGGHEVSKEIMVKRGDAILELGPAINSMEMPGLQSVVKRDFTIKNLQEAKVFESALDRLYPIELIDRQVKAIKQGNNRWTFIRGEFIDKLKGFVVATGPKGQVTKIQYSVQLSQ